MSDGSDHSSLPNGWQRFRFDEVLGPVRQPIRPIDGVVYREIGIRSHGRGIFHKETTSADTLGNKRVFRVVPGCLVFNIVFAWEGAVAVTTSAERDMIASHRFPMFAPIGLVRADVDYLRRHFASQPGVRQLGLASPGGAGRNRTLNQRDLAALRLPLPPLPEQRKIAAILSSVDETIEKTEAVVAQLQVVKKAMMQELLTRGMPGRHTRFKQTEIGEIPEGWEVRTLGDCGSWFSGGTPSKANEALWRGSLPWVSPKDMKLARIGDAQDHVHEDAVGQGTRAVPPGTLLMVVRGMILAHSFPVCMTTARVAFNQDIKALSPSPDFDAEYLLYFLECSKERVLGLMDVANHGTKRLPTERLFAVSVPQPPLSEQRLIAAALAAQERVLDTTRESRARLLGTKAALSAALLSGDLRVAPDEVR